MRSDMVREVAGMSGVALVSIGAGLVYVPAGLIVAGVLLIALAILSAKGG